MKSARRRQTRQRRLILVTVASTASHPTAEWVYARVRRQMPRVSLGTVYRNLQLLVADGSLRSWTRGRTTRYDADLAPHDHFSCRECGLLLDLPRSPRAFGEERKLRRSGHEIEDRILEFVGTCRDCRRGRQTGGTKRCPDGKDPGLSRT